MIQRLPGTEDIFPDRTDKWNRIKDTAKNVFKTYNFKEIVTPVMEATEVFERGLGDTTDIVSKEMFTFEDRGGRSITLRPEGTASVVRAYINNGEYSRLSLAKFFYMGPMFRAERPQKGRLRQFNQFGAELFGSDDPYCDFEVISMMNTIAEKTGVKNYTLLINSIGCPECRKDYVAKLKEYYQSKEDRLCKDCRARLYKNPLRLLDCKVDDCRKLKEDAPVITSFLDKECRSHYEKVKFYLTEAGIAFTEDPFLVRGLDYYTRTTFEFVTNDLGGQNAFAAGGRYDHLVEQFQGKPTPAVGFAAGIERIFLLTEDQPLEPEDLTAYIIHFGEQAKSAAVSLAASLRAAGISADMDPAGGSFKTQFKKAERENAAFAVIIGDDELKSGTVQLKNQKTGEQISVAFDQLIDKLKQPAA